LWCLALVALLILLVTWHSKPFNGIGVLPYSLPGNSSRQATSAPLAGSAPLFTLNRKNHYVDSGNVKWAENSRVGYFAQDNSAEFEKDMSLFDWITQWQPTGAGEEILRATLGRMLFSRDDSEKSVNVVSGGEQRRLMFGKLILQKPNVMIMDEPTNHLDMESIEALNLALEHYPGTLIFISHDRDFVSSLATRIIDITPDGVIDYTGTYDEYLRAQMLNEKIRVA